MVGGFVFNCKGLLPIAGSDRRKVSFVFFSLQLSVCLLNQFPLRLCSCSCSAFVLMVEIVHVGKRKSHTHVSSYGCGPEREVTGLRRILF